MIYKLNFKSHKAKAFFISLFLHSTLLVALLYSATTSRALMNVSEAKETIMMVSLLATPPKSLTPKVVLPPKAVKKAKIIEKPKATHKPKPISKKKVPLKKAVEKKPTPQKETIVQAMSLPPSDVSLKELVQITSTNPTQVKEVQTPESKQLEEISPNQLAKIRSMIQNSLVYPPMARRLKIEGTVVVSFVLSTDGKVQSANILSRSGNTSLDKKALQTVLALSGEYPQLHRKIDLKIPISFSLKNS